MEDLRKPTWGYTATHRKTNSFAGGMPFLRRGERWPVDAEGQQLAFLFQCDLSEVEDLGLELPKKGLLQFFHRPDDLHGMDMDSIGSEAGAKRVLVRLVTDAQDLEVKPPKALQQALEGGSPLKEPLERVYYEGELAWMKPAPGSVDAPEEQEEEDSPQEEDAERAQDEEEAPADSAPEFEFHLGGYPVFTQDDFRQSQEGFTLILGSESGDHVMWGDMGCAGFWLPDEAADECELQHSFLYWDCY